MVLLGFALNEIAVFGEFTDERIDLAQAQRQLRTPFQIAADKTVVVRRTALQGHIASLIHHRWAMLLGQRQYALNAAHRLLPLLFIHPAAHHPDLPAGSSSAQQQVLHRGRRVFGAVFVFDPMFATRLRQMFPQQLAGLRVQQADRAVIPLDRKFLADPSGGAL